MSDSMTSITAQLVELLSTVRRPGDFCTSGTTELLAPALEVEGVGPVALPLLPLQAEQLAAVAARAPYGRGQDTLVDTAVRRTWQIGPDKVRIQGRHWPRTLEAILSRVQQGLGLADPIDAQFYKLLLYDTGSFFVSHRDTEKAPGMFATLVIVLPSHCEGGELLVRHQGRESRLDLRCYDPAEVSFAAFYADCLHEVLPVTAGCRLTLVYNVLRRGHGKAPEPPDYSGEQIRAAALLRQWTETAATPDNEAPLKLVHLLEHAYTPAELGFHTLKGADAGAAGVLSAAAREAGCDLHLALLTREESGSAEHTGYSRRGHRYDDDDDDEFEIDEVFDWSVLLSEWRTQDGSPSPLGEIPVVDAELSPPGAFNDLEPDEIHFSEATGNEGASFERAYRRAVLVLWPHGGTFAVLCQAGRQATLPYLEDMAQRWTEDGADVAAPLRRDAHDLAGHMIAQWQTRHWHPPRDDAPTDPARMLTALTTLKDTACIEDFLTGVTAAGVYAKADNTAMLRALGLLPRETSLGLIERIVRATGATAFAACADLLARTAAAAPDHAAGLRAAAAALVGVLPAPAQPRQPWEVSGPSVDPAFIVDLQTALATIDEALADRAVVHILAWPKTYDPDKALVPAAKLLRSAANASPAAGRLHAACLAHLRARIAEPLAPPADWRRPSAVGCRCAHCTELARYLADPARETWIFKANESDRSHVEGTIRTAHCDVDTATDRRGRPYSLICIKNQASYERRAKQRVEDTKNLAVLSR
jgi:predicted 2-oxoglutarate/Fe(II)-dependent dioxygenase YbiX